MISKKGVESFPFFLFLTLLIAAFVISIGFSQIRTFSKFSSKKELTEDYQNLINSMKNLRATTDQGSFTRVNLNVPKGYNITISSKNDTIYIRGPDLDLNNTPGLDILNLTNKYRNPTNEIVLKKGNYNLVVYYGEYNSEKAEPYEIFFV